MFSLNIHCDEGCWCKQLNIFGNPPTVALQTRLQTLSMACEKLILLLFCIVCSCSGCSTQREREIPVIPREIPVILVIGGDNGNGNDSVEVISADGAPLNCTLPPLPYIFKHSHTQDGKIVRHWVESHRIQDEKKFYDSFWNSPARLILLEGRCVIGLWDSVIITGGKYSRNIVQEYNLSSEALRRLPDLKTGRQDHACGRFIHNEEVVSRMLM